jgi:hypothetical protein
MNSLEIVQYAQLTPCYPYCSPASSKIGWKTTRYQYLSFDVATFLYGRLSEMETVNGLGCEHCNW